MIRSPGGVTLSQHLRLRTGIHAICILMKGRITEMKFIWVVALPILIFAAPVKAEEGSVLKDQKDKISYTIGLNIGDNIKKQSIDVNPQALLKGIQDAISGAKPLLTDAEMKDVLSALKAQKEQEMVATAAKNKQEGDAFLTANKTKEGVKSLPSGLQYKVIKQGTGAKPKETDTVKVNYKGTLLDGTVFDSSEQHGGPATLQVNRVIKGWTEALQLMEVGSKW